MLREKPKTKMVLKNIGDATKCKNVKVKGKYIIYVS